MRHSSARRSRFDPASTMAASAARESKPKSGRVMPILSNTRVKIAETDTARNEPRVGGGSAYQPLLTEKPG